MQAAPGDRIIVKGRYLDEPNRDGEVLEVRGKDGGPPYEVRWSDGHTALFFPAGGVEIHHGTKSES
jgi:hypothetical protein